MQYLATLPHKPLIFVGQMALSKSTILFRPGTLVHIAILNKVPNLVTFETSSKKVPNLSGMNSRPALTLTTICLGGATFCIDNLLLLPQNGLGGEELKVIPRCSRSSVFSRYPLRLHASIVRSLGAFWKNRGMENFSMGF